MRGSGLGLLLGALLVGTPAAAQVAGGAQPAPPITESYARTFTYLGSNLLVTVTGEAPGTIQVVRGENGRVDVSARAAGGLPVATLGSGTVAELILSPGAAQRVDYVVIVPEDARVSVHRPGQPAVTLGTLDRVATWKWAGQPAEIPSLPDR